MSNTTRDIENSQDENIPLYFNEQNNFRQYNRNSIITNIQQIQRVIATGSAESIIKWSKRKQYNRNSQKYLGFDKNQRKAFIVMIAHFVMTYINDAENES